MNDDRMGVSGPAADPEPSAFHYYPVTHRVTAWISRNLFDWCTYEVRHGLIKGMRRKGGLGWIPRALSTRVETKEHAFLESLSLGGLNVYDVGAFHGILTLFFAKRCASVVAYEPNARHYRRLRENVRLNGLNNVVTRRVGLGSHRGAGVLSYSPLMSGGGSLRSVEAKLPRLGHECERIDITSLDEDIAESELPVPDFMKVDVEGYELEVLQGARATLATHRPTLFLEMHGLVDEKKRNVRDIVSFLTEAGYRNIVHVETGQRISASNTAAAAEGHLYCLAG